MGTQWGYRANASNRECLVEWAAYNDLILLHNPKGAANFTSGRWNTGTNPDLAFASTGPDNMLPDRCVLEKFPRSRHRPSLTTAVKLVAPVLSEPMKRWNFRKADWNNYSLFTNKATQSLTSSSITNVEEAYQDLCSAVIKAAKRSILCSHRNNYIPCWDKECESFYCAFFDQRRCEQWNKTIDSFEFSHTNRLAWSTLNRLIGRLRHTSCKGPVSANSIASQVMRNGIFPVRDHDSARLVASEVSDLWRVLTPDSQSLSGDFTIEELTSALQHLNHEKAAGPDSICPELILHAGSEMKSWLCEFLSSCLRNLKIARM